jgi:predicted helicase
LEIHRIRGVSSNETAYANSLVEKYKVEPGGEQKLQERKHWLNDDYVKFIALAEGMVKKAGEGVVAMITNNGYLDNPTFRGMRWNLANTFDQIYILDLHGNVNRKESGADGIKDENVFNIMQGVSIILAVKSGKKRANALGEVYHAEIYGKRELKFKYIEGKIKWEKIKLDKKMVFFLPKNTEGQEEYEAGVRIDELFLKNVTGILTMGDSFIIDENKKVIAERIENLALNRYSESSLNKEFNLGKNYANFIIKNSKELQYNENKLTKIAYRPFDIRWTYFDNKVLWRWREEIMKNFIGKENLGLVIPRQAITNNYSHVMISNTIIDNRIQYSNKGIPIIIPLYIFHEDGTKSPNLSPEIVQKFEEIVGETQPEQIFYYIYAVLYSPIYREKYKEFLKVNFPRIPFPKDLESFKKLSELGSELKQIHLLESPIVNQFITTFPLTGSNIVEKVEYKHGSVFINTNQYFGKVPEIAWSFYIGGYQPIQKWLKDRKNKTLTNEDIEHYQKIIVAMVETDELMKRIDKIFRD